MVSLICILILLPFKNDENVLLVNSKICIFPPTKFTQKFPSSYLKDKSFLIFSAATSLKTNHHSIISHENLELKFMKAKI